MNLYVGTSGFSYTEWKGSFYPKGLPQKEMLGFYSKHFLAVEINSSFYRLPEAPALQAWAKEVPPEFKFVLKLWQQITHRQRLKNSRETLASFLAAADALGKRRGPLFVQLPPNFKKDTPRLADFLELIPKRYRTAIEFRHASWFDDEIFALLRQRQVAFCVAEAEDDLSVPFVATADFGYLRLRRTDYQDADLKSWAKRVRESRWKEAYVFFRHEDKGTAPKFARKFLEFAD